MADDTEQAVRLAEEKWRYPRRPRSHRFDGWLSREMDLAFWRLDERSPGADGGRVIGALEAILEDVDRSDQALFAAHARATIGWLQQILGHGDRGLRHDARGAAPLPRPRTSRTGADLPPEARSP